jgi:hypothetical protein
MLPYNVGMCLVESYPCLFVPLVVQSQRFGSLGYRLSCGCQQLPTEGPR